MFPRYLLACSCNRMGVQCNLFCQITRGNMSVFLLYYEFNSAQLFHHIQGQWAWTNLIGRWRYRRRHALNKCICALVIESYHREALISAGKFCGVYCSDFFFTMNFTLFEVIVCARPLGSNESFCERQRCRGKHMYNSGLGRTLLERALQKRDLLSILQMCPLIESYHRETLIVIKIKRCLLFDCDFSCE